MNELMINQPKEVTILGNKGLVKYDGHGMLQAIEVDVELSYNRNEIWKLPTYEYQKRGNYSEKVEVGAKWMLTAEGFEVINKVAGLRQLLEPKFVLNGEEITNPQIITDKTGRKQSASYKVTLYGPGPDGKNHFSSALIHYNINDEFIASILSKIQYKKNNEEPIGMMCPSDAFAEVKKHKPYAIFIPTDQITDEISLGIAVDCMHPDFAKLRNVQQEKINTLERKMHTIARRNAFRKHPATAFYTVDPVETETNNKLDYVATLKVVRWIQVDEAAIEAEIEEYLRQEAPESVAYHETEPEQDFEDTENIIEVATVEEVVDEYEDTQERRELLKWIPTKGLGLIGKTAYEAIVENPLDQYTNEELVNIQEAIFAKDDE